MNNITIKMLVLTVIAIIIGFLIGKKCNNANNKKKLNINFKNINSKGTKIIIGISCIICIIGIVAIITLKGSSNNLTGKLYKMTDTKDIATMYFQNNEIVRVEYISKKPYNVDSQYLKYTFKNDILTITTENGSNMTYTYNKSTDCFTYSTGIEYCN